jgi:glucan 1,3-beta-glucosidase
MSPPANGNSIVPALAHYALTALAIGVVWWWLGAPVHLPPSPLAAGGKLYCISYAPFRDAQNPLVENTRVSAEQIDQDLALLSRYTDCIRTYSVANGLEQIPAIAQRYGLKMLLGLWLSNGAEKNRVQITTAIDLAKKYPDVIRAVVVGNEVLLRGELAATDLAATIREVKAQVSMPVTYADVWEFWLRYSDLQTAVDFVTIHILPYWEDFPLPASLAAAHVDAIRKQVVAAIPNKEIVIGEIGWPSAGRMREAARPSPSNQARVIAETLTLAQRENFRVNVIEAFDQPWKRDLEGSSGRYWGIFDRATGSPKFNFDGIVSDHPYWPLQALAGMILAAAAFAAAAMAGRGKSAPPLLWMRIVALVLVPSVLLGWTIEMVPVDSYTMGGCGHGGRGADRMRCGMRERAAATELCRSARPLGRPIRCVGRRARRDLDGAHITLGADRVRACFRPALPRPSIRAAKRRRPCVPGLAGCDAAQIRTGHRRRAGDGGDRGGGAARRLGDLHRDQRNLRQLASDLAVRRIDRTCRHSGAGAGRARLRISTPAASAERSALCSTMPKPAAASASVTSTMDGRSKFSTAAASATPPKTL